MTFYLLGGGRIAHFAASRLTFSGNQCLGIYSRNPASVANLAETLSAPVFDNVKALTATVDACLLAVSDDAIASIARQLPLQKGTVCHFSGTIALDALEPHPHHAVCWPVYSIGNTVFPEKEIPAVGEGNTETAYKVLRSLCQALSLNLFEAPQAARRQMHLAAVMGNNFVNHLLCICEEICREAAVPPDILRPLLEQTFKGAISGNPCQNQTGPARRRDLGTQAAHLELLTQHPDWQRVYEAISDSIGKLYGSQ